MKPETLLPSDPYRVQAGDTLSSIGKRCGRTPAELQRFNGLADANRITAGQTLYLSEQSAFGFSVLFLDALRAPIANLPWRLRFDDRLLEGRTADDGRVPRQTSAGATSGIGVEVCRLDGGWQQVTQALSGCGHKLITLVSNAIILEGATEPVAADVKPHLLDPLPTQPTPPTAPGSKQPALPAAVQGAPSKNDPEIVRVHKTKGPKQQPLIRLNVELPADLLALFAKYDGELITQKMWNDAASTLSCEVEVLQAFAIVESRGEAFWQLNDGKGAHVPAILYERHIFSRCSRGRFDADHPDISWPTEYRGRNIIGREDKFMQSGVVDRNDVYGDYSSSYLRLVRAFRLDEEAALKACSWGKFQILGQNFAECNQRNVMSLVVKMVKSEASQIDPLTSSIENKPAVSVNSKNRKNRKLGKHPSLLQAVRSKDWAMIAFNYNGPNYKKGEYDTKLQRAYLDTVRSTSK